jgi:hypothetical protein
MLWIIWIAGSPIVKERTQEKTQAHAHRAYKRRANHRLGNPYRATNRDGY